MKSSFKQFLEDIELDDRAYGRHDSDETVAFRQHSINKDKEYSERFKARWEKLPVDFPIKGFEVWWGKPRYEGLQSWNVVLLDTSQGKRTVAIDLSIDGHTIKLPVAAGNAPFGETSFGELHGVVTDVLSSSRKYRGKGLAPELYSTLVRNGQVLFSSTTQTTGGKSTWIRMLSSLKNEADIAVVMPVAGIYNSKLQSLLDNHRSLNRQSAPEILKLLDDTTFYTGGHSLLAVGSIPALEEVAYSRHSFFWVAAPKGTLDRYLPLAIKV